MDSYAGAPRSGNPVMNQMRAMRYLRPQNARAPRSSNGSPMAMPQGIPDLGVQADDPEYQAAAGKLLSPYGLHPLDPQAANPFVMFQNQGFAANHPGIAHAIEGGVMGAATTQGANTWGEGISNVAKSLLSVPQMRQQMLNRQYQAPFEQAEQMQGLQNQQLQGQSLQTMMEYHRAQIDHLKNGPDAWDKAQATRPVVLPDGTYLTNDPVMGWGPHGDPMKDPNLRRGSSNKVPASMVPYFGKLGVDTSDPSAITQEQWSAATNLRDSTAVNVASGRTTATTKARMNVEKTLPGQENAAESPEVKQLRNDFDRDYSQMDTEGYRDKIEQDLITQNALAKSKQPMPTDQQVQDVINQRKSARQSQFNQDVQKAKQPASPMSAPKKAIVKYNQVTGTLE